MASAWASLGMGVFLVYFSAYDTWPASARTRDEERPRPSDTQQEAMLKSSTTGRRWSHGCLAQHPRHGRVGASRGLPGGRSSSRACTACGVAAHRGCPSSCWSDIRRRSMITFSSLLIAAVIHERQFSRVPGRPPTTGRDRPSPSRRARALHGCRWADGRPPRTWRRVGLLGIPFLYVVLGLMHSTANPSWPRDRPLRQRAHRASSSSRAGLRAVAARGRRHRRVATFARALIIPFLVAYTALDAILGIVRGIAERQRTACPPPTSRQQVGSSTSVLRGTGSTGPHPLLGCRPLWLAVALAVVAALRHTAPLGALVPMASARPCSRSDTPRRSPIGMGLFLLGMVDRVPPPSSRDALAAKLIVGNWSVPRFAGTGRSRH